jgi:hypothetical protein
MLLSLPLMRLGLAGLAGCMARADTRSWYPAVSPGVTGDPKVAGGTVLLWHKTAPRLLLLMLLEAAAGMGLVTAPGVSCSGAA